MYKYLDSYADCFKLHEQALKEGKKHRDKLYSYEKTWSKIPCA